MTKKELIEMAIWMHNRLIDNYPMIYRYLKEQYIKEKDEQEK